MLDPTLVAGIVGFVAGRGGAFVDNILGPTSKEMGKDLRERYRTRKARNLADVVIDASRMVEEAGFEPQPIPGRILGPLFEAASVEEDPHLKKRWATLLANAADPSNKRTVTPAFGEILRQLSPEEALMLSAVYDRTNAGGSLENGVFYVNQPDGTRQELPLPYGNFQALSDNLHRLGLVDFKFGSPGGMFQESFSRTYPLKPKYIKLYEGLPLSPLGRLFMAAVSREPKDDTPEP